MKNVSYINILKLINRLHVITFIKKRIVHSLFPHVCVRAMAAKNIEVVWQSQNFVIDRVKDLFRRTTWQVGSAYASGKNCIAAEDDFFSMLDKAEASFSMAWSMPCFEAKASAFDNFAIIQESVGFDRFDLKR